MKNASPSAESPYLSEYAVNIENTAFYMIKNDNKPLDPHSPQGMVQQIIEYRPHTHAYCELFVCTRGSIVLQCAGYRLTLEKNDLALVPPGVLHIKLPSSDDRDVWRTVGFVCVKRRGAQHRDLYSLLHPFCAGLEPFVVRNSPRLCAMIFDAADEQVVPTDAEHGLLAALHMVELLTNFALQSKQQRPTLDEATLQSKDLRRAATLENLISTQFMHELDTKRAAQMLYVSPRQLERIVKARYGMTLREAVTDVRIKTAAQMLLTSDISIEQIGQAVGFPSRGTFERNFTRIHGMTPLQYRECGGEQKSE